MIYVYVACQVKDKMTEGNLYQILRITFFFPQAADILLPKGKCILVWHSVPIFYLNG